MNGEKNRESRRGFTILELLVSMVILCLLVALVLSITGHVTQLWRDTSGAIGQWQSARQSFTSMTRRISQATLNTTWAYFDDVNGMGNPTTTTPKSYGRYSELQFVCGSAATLLDNVSRTTTQAIFFQAPLGQTQNAELRGLPLLLNACGFYIQFNSAAEFRPALGIFAKAEKKYRFRLMELTDPSENLKIYDHGGASDFDWFRQPIADGEARPMAENVIALIITPKFSRFDATVGSILAPDYSYNSRVRYSFSDGVVKGNTLHQLPPLLQITMVAIDENAGRRLENKFGDQLPAGLFDNAPFASAADYEKDLAQLEKNLVEQRLKYRVFTSVIALRGAKWSGD